jgi:hypothetical protein
VATTYLLALAALGAFWVMLGTNAQARLSRGRLLKDPSPTVRRAGRMWRPVLVGCVGGTGSGWLLPRQRYVKTPRSGLGTRR